MLLEFGGQRRRRDAMRRSRPLPVHRRSARQRSMIRRILLSVLLAALAIPASAQQAPAAPAAPAAVQPHHEWPFDKSDLPPDPAYRFGRLDNGMRYVIRPNATPKGTA